MESDPYKSPVEQTLLELENLHPGGLRERFRNEEMTVLAVGWFYYFFGSLLATIGAAGLVGHFIWGKPLVAALGGVCLIIGPVYIITGFGLRRFDVWARVPSMVAALVAIVIPPVGLLAGVVCLYLLWRNAVREMFTLQYQAAVVAEGELIGHYGWLAVVGGVLSGAALSLFAYFMTMGLL
tara:strand:+ start:902 stop:1444 length:543 start_codon:yes stop_codon:yes gene_type:complete